MTSQDFAHYRIYPVGTLVELCLIAAALVLFNAFPEKVGVLRSLNEPSSFTPLLAPEFQTHLPFLNLYWGLAFGLGLANLIALRWNIATRSIDAALSLLGICVLMELVLGGRLTVYGGIDLLLKFGLAAAIIPSIVDAIRKIRHLLREQFTEPYEQSHAP